MAAFGYRRSEDSDFQCKDPDEVFHASLHQHWIRLAWPFTKTLLLTALILSIGGLTFSTVQVTASLPRHLILLFLLAFFLIIQCELLVRFYRYFLYLIIITDRRVHRIKKTLITTDEHECIDLWVLQEIQKIQRGPLQNLLGFGSLKLEAQDTHLTLHFIPHINERYGEIMHLREIARSSARRMAPDSHL